MSQPETASKSLAAVAGALLAAAVIFGDGSSDDRVLWIGGAAVIAAGAVLAGAPRVSRPGLAATMFFAFLAAFVVWSGLSVLWSMEPDRSWSYFNRSAVYLAFGVVGFAAGARVPRASRHAAAVLAVAFGVVLAWALAGKVLPDLDPDGERVARLRGSFGYWNALALAAAMAVPVAVWAAARRAHAHTVRAGGVLLLYVATVALLLTYSRAGALVAAGGFGLWLLLGSPRLESVVAALIACPVGLAVAVVGFALPGISDDGQSDAVRADDGLVFGLALLAGAAVVTAAAYLASRREARLPLDDRLRRRLGRATAIAVAAVLASALVAGVARAGGPVEWVSDAVDEFTAPLDPGLEDDPRRLGELSSNTRWSWWKDALEVFREHPVAGTGAGAYDVARRPFRDDSLAPVAPHSLPLQFLSELGLVGILLIGAAAAAAVAAIASALRRVEGVDRAAAAALAAVVAVYAVDGLAEFNWDFLVLSAPVFYCLGLLLGMGTGAPRPAPRRLLRAAAAVAGAAALLLSLALPWLAERKVEDARAAIERPDESARLAEDAHDLNPLSIEPLFLWADAEEARGDLREARRLYVEAVELQPENARTWRELGEFELEARGDLERAERYLARARELDPLNRQTKELLEKLDGRP